MDLRYKLLLFLYRNEVKNSIINLFSEIASKTKKKQTVICLFKCLPIIHFLRDDCTPRQVISLTSSHISFGLDSTLKMNAIHFAMTNKTG